MATALNDKNKSKVEDKGEGEGIDRARQTDAETKHDEREREMLKLQLPDEQTSNSESLAFGSWREMLAILSKEIETIEDAVKKQPSLEVKLNASQKVLRDKVTSESSLLAAKHFEILIDAMPVLYKQHKWNLLYSTARDGISLQTLYRHVAKTSPTVLLVKDLQEDVFGVFGTDPWERQDNFYGTGETFVFQLEPEIHVYHWNQKENSEQKRNDYFMYSTGSCIAVGGGGHFALWLDEDLLYGNSAKSETFGNECLAGEGKEVFKIKSIEVWGLSM